MGAGLPRVYFKKIMISDLREALHYKEAAVLENTFGMLSKVSLPLTCPNSLCNLLLFAIWIPFTEW